LRSTYWDEQFKVGSRRPPEPEPIDQLALFQLQDGGDWVSQSNVSVTLDNMAIGQTGARAFEAKFATSANGLAGAGAPGAAALDAPILGGG
jgi:hypothetical protein